MTENLPIQQPKYRRLGEKGKGHGTRCFGERDRFQYIGLSSQAVPSRFGFSQRFNPSGLLCLVACRLLRLFSTYYIYSAVLSTAHGTHVLFTFLLLFFFPNSFSIIYFPCIFERQF